MLCVILVVLLFVSKQGFFEFALVNINRKNFFPSQDYYSFTLFLKSFVNCANRRIVKDMEAFLKQGNCQFAHVWLKQQNIHSIDELQLLAVEVPLIELIQLTRWSVGNCVRFLSHCRGGQSKAESKTSPDVRNKQGLSQLESYFAVFIQDGVLLAKGDKITLTQGDPGLLVRRPSGEFLGRVNENQAKLIPHLVNVLLDVKEIGELHGLLKILTVTLSSSVSKPVVTDVVSQMENLSISQEYPPSVRETTTDSGIRRRIGVDNTVTITQSRNTTDSITKSGQSE